MKHPLSVRIDDKLWPYIKGLPNKARYIEGLIREDIHQKNQEGIYTAITDRLLRDAEYLTKLSRKLSQASRAPVVEKQDDVQLIANDWGA